MDESLRAADRDRDQVMDALREHYAQGRITIQEFDERGTAAATAKTMGDLRALTADLPDPPTSREAAWTPKQMRRIAVMGIAAATAVLTVLGIFGHLIAVPVWLVVLVAIRVLQGKRRTPRVGGPRPPRC
jgi:hypothetical protein